MRTKASKSPATAGKNALGRASHFFKGNLLDLPFEHETFDLVWTSYVLHHVADKLAAVRELQRVLKPGRRLAIREGGLPLHSLPHDFGLGEPGWNIVCTTLKITGLPP